MIELLDKFSKSFIEACMTVFSGQNVKHDRVYSLLF